MLMAPGRIDAFRRETAMQEETELGADGVCQEELSAIHERARLHLERMNPAVDQTAFMRAREEQTPRAREKRSD